MKEYLGKRILARSNIGYCTSLLELEILEVSNSCTYFKCKNILANTTYWLPVEDYIVIEVLA